MNPRLVVVLSVLSSLAALSPASADAPTAAAHRVTPTKLDFLVLASLADTSSMLAVSNLRDATVIAGEKPHYMSGEASEPAEDAAAKAGD